MNGLTLDFRFVLRKIKRLFCCTAIFLALASECLKKLGGKNVCPTIAFETRMDSNRVEALLVINYKWRIQRHYKFVTLM